MTPEGNYSIIQARLETIERLDAAIRAGATEVPEIHNVVKEFPWLLDPRWSLLGDEIDLSTLQEPYEPTIDPENGSKIGLPVHSASQSPTAPFDELLVVEIKRGVKSNGQTHRVSEEEVNKFHSYVLGVHADYDRNTAPPSVNGLMIANGYTQRADRTRRSLEQVREVRLEFKTWDTVIDYTRRLHTGWLEVTRSAGSFSGDGDDSPSGE